MDKPVYLFTGFIGSGKTTMIKDSLSDPQFTEDERTLLICLEEGEEEYSKSFLKKYNTDVVYTDFEKITPEYYDQLEDMYDPDRVIIEMNGMRKVDDLMNILMPLNWILVQILSAVEAPTFKLYCQNMQSVMYEQLRYSQIVVCNRTDDDTDKAYIRNNIKAMNQGTQILFMDYDNNIVEFKFEDLTFDTSKKEIDIPFSDYGLWYMDAGENPQKYDGKIITLEGKVCPTPNVKNAYVLGREAMVCCAQDTNLIGLLVRQKKGYTTPKENQWLKLKAMVCIVDDPQYGLVPELYELERTEIPEVADGYVYFN